MRSLFILLCLLSLGCGRTDQPTSQITSQVLLHPHTPEHVNHTIWYSGVPSEIRDKIWGTEQRLIRALLALEETDTEIIDSIIDKIVTRRKQVETYRVFADVDGMALVGTGGLGNTWVEHMANIMLTMTSKHPEIREKLHYDTGFYFVLFHPGYYEIEQLPEWKEFIKGRSGIYYFVAGYCMFGGETEMCVAPSRVFDFELRGGLQPTNSWRVAIHEFAHAMDKGISQIDPNFRNKLQQAYENAKEKNLWTYRSLAGTIRENSGEYWAEGVETWFIGNWVSVEAPVIDREWLLQFDPKLYKLLDEWLPQKSLEFLLYETDEHLREE